MLVRRMALGRKVNLRAFLCKVRYWVQLLLRLGARQSTPVGCRPHQAFNRKLMVLERCSLVLELFPLRLEGLFKLPEQHDQGSPRRISLAQRLELKLAQLARQLLVRLCSSLDRLIF